MGWAGCATCQNRYFDTGVDHDNKEKNNYNIL